MPPAHPHTHTQTKIIKHKQVLTFIVSGVLLGAFFYGKLTDGPNALQVHILIFNLFIFSYV